MSDNVKLQIESAESVALTLANRVAEKEDLYTKSDFRKNYLDLYAECLKATKGLKRP
jgi:hypothetical protein